MTTVLVAEDDQDIRDLLMLKLTAAGYEVVAAADGPQALSVARQRRTELALLDVAMPGLTGLEVCRRLRADPATARMVIVLVSALARQSDVAAGLRAGADDFIRKPFRIAELPAQLEALLARAGR